MTNDAGQIERIVREVLLRLTSAAPGLAAATPDSRPETIAPATIAPEVTAAGQDVLVLPARLVTAQMLVGRLTGITCVEVHPKAVVTPLVKDLLREGRIQLKRVATQSLAGATTSPRLGLVLEGNQAGAMRRSCARSRVNGSRWRIPPRPSSSWPIPTRTVRSGWCWSPPIGLAGHVRRIGILASGPCRSRPRRAWTRP